MSAQPEIPNGNFEEWGMPNTWNYTPIDWVTMNMQLIESTVMDSLPYEGELAMKVKSIPGFEGAVQGVSYTTVELSAIPPSLNFYVKCFVDGEDTVWVDVSFWNTLIPEAPIYSETWISTESIDDWTGINLELEQIEPVIDYAIVSVKSGYNGFLGGGSWDTWISVDAMGFDVASNIENTIHSDIATVFPNPGKNEITINTSLSVDRIEMRSSDGKLCMESRYDYELDTSELRNGLYHISVYFSNGTYQTLHWIKQ
jgi:hypothetical protein